MDISSREQFSKRVTVKQVSLGDDTCFIRLFKKAERDKWLAYLSTLTSSENTTLTAFDVKAFLIALSLSDKDGNLLYSENDTSEIAALDVEILDGLFTAIKKLNRIDGETEEQKKTT